MPTGPLGPFRPHSDRAVTPHDWFALDGTLFVEDGKPWIVFCHEWVQIQDGTMEAAPLSDDLKTLAAKPKTLFHASDAPWKRPGNGKDFVTDGPFLYRHSNGDLLMLWSSFGTGDYTVGIARSKSGKVLGPWTQDEKPLYENGGHCMIFRTFTGETPPRPPRPQYPAKRTPETPPSERDQDRPPRDRLLSVSSASTKVAFRSAKVCRTIERVVPSACHWLLAGRCMPKLTHA